MNPILFGRFSHTYRYACFLHRLNQMRLKRYYIYGKRGGKLVNNKLSCSLFAQRAGVEDIKSKGLKRNQQTNRTKLKLLLCFGVRVSCFSTTKLTKCKSNLVNLLFARDI